VEMKEQWVWFCFSFLECRIDTKSF
jgi:hypothetical protein